MQPDLILVPFAQDAPAVNVDAIPVDLSPSDPPQSASWSQGFPTVTMTPLAAGGIPPRGQSFNGVLKDISEHLVFIGGGGQYRWSQDYVTAKGGYSIGDVIQSDDGKSAYVSLVDSNTANFNTTPASIGTNWAPYSGLVLSPAQATESALGSVMLASQSEAEAGTDTLKAMTPLRVFQAIRKNAGAYSAFNVISTSTALAIGSSNLVTAVGLSPTLPVLSTTKSGDSVTVAARMDTTILVSGAGQINYPTIGSTTSFPLRAGEQVCFTSNGSNAWSCAFAVKNPQYQEYTAFSTTGTAAALVLTPQPAVQAIAAPLRFRVRFSQASTPTTTINVSATGAKLLKQYDSSGVKVPAVYAANQLGDIEYDGTDWVLLNQLPTNPVQRKQNFRGLSKNLKASASGVSASVPVTADNVIVANAAGDAQAITGINLTLNTAAVASATVDGMASGVTAINTWYAVYAWYNSTTGVTRITGDSSFTTPTAPAAGFDMWALISVFYTDNTASKFPLGFNQVGAKWRYVIKAGTNLTAPRLIASGSTGGVNPTTQLAINLVVCPGALVISIGLTAQNGTAAVVSTANNGGSWNSITFPTPLAAGAQATMFAVTTSYDLVLEQPNAIFWGANGAGASLIIHGFEVPQ